MKSVQRHWSENVGTLGVAGLAVLCAYIAMRVRRFQRYGREALLCAAVFIGLQAVTRSLSINGVITSVQARSLVGITAFFCLGVMGQIAWLKRVEAKQEKEDQG